MPLLHCSEHYVRTSIQHLANNPTSVISGKIQSEKSPLPSCAGWRSVVLRHKQSELVGLDRTWRKWFVVTGCPTQHCQILAGQVEKVTIQMPLRPQLQLTCLKEHALKLLLGFISQVLITNHTNLPHCILSHHVNMNNKFYFTQICQSVPAVCLGTLHLSRNYEVGRYSSNCISNNQLIIPQGFSPTGINFILHYNAIYKACCFMQLCPYHKVQHLQKINQFVKW